MKHLKTERKTLLHTFSFCGFHNFLYIIKNIRCNFMGTWKHFIANSLQNFGVYEKLITLWSDNLTMIRFPIPIRKIT